MKKLIAVQVEKRNDAQDNVLRELHRLTVFNCKAANLIAQEEYGKEVGLDCDNIAPLAK